MPIFPFGLGECEVVPVVTVVHTVPTVLVTVVVD